MRRLRFKQFGPFSYFRVKKRHKNFLSAWLTGHDGAFGWEWGTDGESTNPSFCIRLNHFNLLSYEKFEKGGYTFWFMGFWMMDL